MLGLEGQVGAELGEVHPGPVPQHDRLVGHREQVLGLVVVPLAVGVANQELSQTCSAQSEQSPGVAVPGQQVQGRVPVLGAELFVPARPEQLEQGADPGEHGRASRHHREALFGRPTQWVRWSVTGVGAQPLGVQQRQPGQQGGVERRSSLVCWE